jgi:hypothetical protein
MVLKSKAPREILRWSAVAALLHGCNVNGTTPNPSLQDGSITESKMADGSIDVREIRPNAVTTNAIAAGAVTAAKLDPAISINTTGNTTLGGTLAVTGATTHTGAVTFNGTAAHNAQVTMTGAALASGGPNSSLTIASTTTQTGAGTIYGIFNQFSASPATPATTTLNGFYNTFQHTTAQNNTSPETAAYNILNNASSGTLTAGNGLQSFVQNSATGTITTSMGVLGQSLNSNSGSLVTAYGVLGQVSDSSTGAITTGIGVEGDVINTSTAVITTGYGLHTHLTNSGGGTVTTFHSLHMDDPTNGGGGFPAGYFDIYAVGNVMNYVQGRLGINNPAPADQLDVTGNTALTGNLSVSGTVTMSGLAANNTGDFLCWNAGNVTAGTTCTLSDRRLKKDIVPLTGSLEGIRQLNGVTYYWKDPKRSHDQQLGLIAQDVEKVFPQAVKKNADGFLSLNYYALFGPVVESIKELYAKWSADHKALEQHDVKLGQLEKKIELENVALRAENASLKARLDKIEQALAATPVKTPSKKGRKLASQ